MNTLMSLLPRKRTKDVVVCCTQSDRLSESLALQPHGSQYQGKSAEEVRMWLHGHLFRRIVQSCMFHHTMGII